MNEDPVVTDQQKTVDADFAPENVSADNGDTWESVPGVWEEIKDYFFTWLRKVWKVRGGGLYAVGWALSFLYLEVTDILFDDIPSIIAMESYGPGPMLAVLIEFVVDTIKNTVLAFLWPLLLIAWQQPWGAIALLVALLVFPRYVKPHLEQWLTHREDPEASSEQT